MAKYCVDSGCIAVFSLARPALGGSRSVGQEDTAKPEHNNSSVGSRAQCQEPWPTTARSMPQLRQSQSLARAWIAATLWWDSGQALGEAKAVCPVAAASSFNSGVIRRCHPGNGYDVGHAGIAWIRTVAAGLPDWWMTWRSVTISRTTVVIRCSSPRTVGSGRGDWVGVLPRIANAGHKRR
jgi:hypothetical protein